jgi:hypothetical protein
MFPPLVLALCLKTTGATHQLKLALLAYFIAYSGCIVFTTVHGIIHNATGGGEAEQDYGFDMSLYYAWMTFHNRCYGEIIPEDDAAHELLAVISSILSFAPFTSACVVVVGTAGRQQQLTAGGTHYVGQLPDAQQVQVLAKVVGQSEAEK